jgi:hypothetical protein
MEFAKSDQVEIWDQLLSWLSSSSEEIWSELPETAKFWKQNSNKENIQIEVTFYRVYLVDSRIIQQLFKNVYSFHEIS